MLEVNLLVLENGLPDFTTVKKRFLIQEDNRQDADDTCSNIRNSDCR